MDSKTKVATSFITKTTQQRAVAEIFKRNIDELKANENAIKMLKAFSRQDLANILKKRSSLDEEQNKIFAENLIIKEMIGFLNNGENFVSPINYLYNLFESKCSGKDFFDTAAENLGRFDAYEKICSYDDDISTSTKDNIQKKSIKAAKATVNKWRKDADILISRDNAIKLAFMMKLNINETNELLNKACRQYNLSFRSAAESTYIHGLLNGKTFYEAYDIVNKYNKLLEDNKKSILEETLNDNSPIGYTTVLLQDEVMTTDWANDDDFYYKFLYQNIDKFNNFSKTTIRYFFRLRIELTIQIINSRLNDSAVYLGENNEIIDKVYKYLEKLFFILELDGDDKKINSLKLSTEALFDTLENTDNLQKNIDIISKKWMDFSASLNDCLSILNIGQLIKLNDYFQSVVPTKRLLSVQFGDYFEQLSDSQDNTTEINNSLLKNFPHEVYFSNMTSKPLETAGKPYVRKMLLLMNYWKCFNTWRDSCESLDNIYSEFVNNTNVMLDACQMPPLYPADPFDCLMLRSVKTIEENSAYDEYIESDLFRDIIVQFT